MKCFLRSLVEKPEIGACSSESPEWVPREALSADDRRLLHIRTNCMKSIKFVCPEHYSRFLSERYANHQKHCCDPAGFHKKESCELPPAKKRKISAPRSLSEISLALRDKAKSIGLLLIPGKKLCVSCKVRISSQIKENQKVVDQSGEAEPNVVIESSSVVSVPSQQYQTPPPPPVEEPKDTVYKESIDGLNIWLSSIGFSPISESKLRKHRKYGLKVLQKLKAAVKIYVTEESDLEEHDAVYFKEMVQQLQTFIDSHDDPNKKILALSVLPKSWSYEKITETFKVSNHLARKSRQLVNSQGILSLPAPKKGHPINQKTVELVLKYFLSDDVSRPLPGKKDVLSVKEAGERKHKRKRLVLSTLSDLNDKFLKQYPDHKISLAKFCELRPKECVLAGRSGTHVVCVCTHHQNPILMFDAAHLKAAGLDSIKTCRELLLCSEPQVACFFRTCNECPDESKLQEVLELYFDSEMIDSVTYNQWESTDRSNLVTLTKSTDDFTYDFISQVQNLITHDFIAKQQADYYKKKIEALEDGEVVVNLDFAENYSFVIQDSSQGFYFNSKQATIHPFVAYYKKEGKINHENYVVISEHLDHSTAAVHVFQEKLIKHLRDFLKLNLKKIFYFSDGCAGQYKNKTAVANVWFHQRDFNVPAEWHFYATSHGKCACDGVGGMIKHSAMLYSLRTTEPGKQITKPFHLYEWVQRNIKGVCVGWVPTIDVKYCETKLQVRFKTAYDIQGIQSHHTIIPSKSKSIVDMKLFSYDSFSVIRKISTKEFSLEFTDVRGFVTFTEDNQDWQLGHVSKIDMEEETFTLQLLQSVGKNCYEFSDFDVTVTLDEILTLVTPSFQKKGLVVKLLVKDVNDAITKLSVRRIAG